jgi:alpha-D-xyloside xylohydrolase
MFQELYVRWLQYGTFTPMMRSHGTDVPREIYQFGNKGDVVYDAIEKFIRASLQHVALYLFCFLGCFKK